MFKRSTIFGVLALAAAQPIMAAPSDVVWQCAPTSTLDCSSGSCKPSASTPSVSRDRTITFEPGKSTLAACFGTDRCLEGPAVIVRKRQGRYYAVWSKPAVKGKTWKAPGRVTAFFHTLEGGGRQFVMMRSDDIVLTGSCIQR